MTEEFKKGLATGLAIGGVTIQKGGGNGDLFQAYKMTIPTPPETVIKTFKVEDFNISFEIKTFYNV